MKHIITIFKNLGTIVILLFQIGYVSIVDYIRPHDNAKDIKNKTAPHQYTPIDKVTKSYKRTRRLDVSSNNEPLRDVNFNPNTKTISEKQESLERSHRMVEWSENPHYSTTNTKHEPE